MALEAVVLEEAEFAAWLDHAASDAVLPEGELAQAGEALFEAEGCGACHAVRGTPARGAVGPDLTHVGQRLTIGAGILPNTPAAFADWVARTPFIKPAVQMPAYDHLRPRQLAALAAYLEGLQ
jgi:cytochrome c oxidase subunit 2